MASQYTDYYMSQVGKGQADIGHLYHGRGSYTVQRGRGVGSFFANVLRYIRPAFKSGLSAVADQALRSTASIANEYNANAGTKPMKQILKEQGKIALKNLASRGVNKLQKKLQTGSGGIKRKSKSRRSQSSRKKLVRQVGGKKRKKGGKKKKTITGGVIKKKQKKRKKRGTKRKNSFATADAAAAAVVGPRSAKRSRTIDIFTN